MSTPAPARTATPAGALPGAATLAPARRAFHFDAASCSGCKACQIACRDRHALPPGVLWRRVYEVTGGGWEQQGRAWVNDVFAYYLSIACNHCEQARCVEVCPTGAMQQRADGVVLVERERCVGCCYCAWACPYGAPQFDAQAGTMGKCTFCVEDIDAGREPACVAACPLRSLEQGELTDLLRRGGELPAAPPLPDPEITRPALTMRPHARTGAARRHANTRVANREELPHAPAGEASLVAFTLLAQTAAGVLWATCAARWLPVATGQSPSAAFLDDPAFRWPVLGAAALSLLALIAAPFHLGRPLRAWRALANLRHSWLSREVLFAAGFSAAAVLLTLVLWLDGGFPHAIAVLAAVLGGAMVYAMAAVYRLPAVPAWNTPLTTLAFFTSAAVLGVLAALLLFLAPAVARGVAPIASLVPALLVLLCASLLAVRQRVRFYGRNRREL